MKSALLADTLRLVSREADARRTNWASYREHWSFVKAARRPGRRERQNEPPRCYDDRVMDDEKWMAEALAGAHAAQALGEVPIGAVVVRGNEIIGRGHNRREVDGNPLAHAELLALRQAADATAGWRVLDSTLYVTLEPCAMCAGALVNSRVTRLVYGAADPKAGFCGSLGDLTRDPRLNHRLEVTGGVLEQECGDLLRSFFSALRTK